MPHTPSVPTPAVCPELSCGRVFKTPRDLKIHSHVHKPVGEDVEHQCPVDGCSFTAFQLKRMEAHVEATHGDKPPPFECLIPQCGFLTTSAGPFTRHYRERHYMEPPGRKVSPLRRRAPRPMKYGQEELAVTRTPSRPSEPPNFIISFAQSLEPPPSPSPLVESSGALELNLTKYYPPSVNYSPSPPPPPPPPVAQPTTPSLAILSPEVPTPTPVSDMPFPALPCLPTGPSSDQCLLQLTYSSPPHLSLADESSDSSTCHWISWRDECDVASDVIAVATGDRVLCERSMRTCTTEYLPVPVDVGLVEKRFLWA
ncbi:hypothetical protein FB451DRAFT_1531535 [Mycena latifolia]|nr:hypothetical protein FB451DRAFT_1531535 [Mycena latifolia]